MATNVLQIETRLERLWNEYLVARDRAESSRNIRDGIVAGHAWAAWLGEFSKPSARGTGQ